MNKRMLSGKADPRTDLSEGGKSLEIAAEKIGISYGILQEALWLMDNAPLGELEKLRLVTRVTPRGVVGTYQFFVIFPKIWRRC